MEPRKLAPETLMMSLGYKPELSEGALKCPIFQTSTFVFRNAEEGKAFFQVAYGQREKGPAEELGLIYSRLNNPDLEILENRLACWDEAEDCAVFESGMAAISTVLLEFLAPGKTVLFSQPLYGGTHHFIHHVLPKFGIRAIGFTHCETEAEIVDKLRDKGEEGRLAMIFVETPANPTNVLIDLEMVARLASRYRTPEQEVITAVDNTYMGPMWQRPIQFGIDLALYSATKFIGGHSDLIAGSVSGSRTHIQRIKTMRTFFGNKAGPWTGWLLMRRLETLKVRTDQMTENAQHVAAFLQSDPRVTRVHYVGLLAKDSPQFAIAQKQCTSPGSMIAFQVPGGEAEAFRVLNALKVIRLAVSLGGTESLAEHPASMTHVDVDPVERAAMGIDDNMIRLSVGVENVNDLIWDLDQALSTLSR